MLSRQRGHELIDLIITTQSLEHGTICYFESVDKQNFFPDNNVMELNSMENRVYIIPNIKDLTHIPEFEELMIGYDDYIKHECIVGEFNQFITYLPATCINLVIDQLFHQFTLHPYTDLLNLNVIHWIHRQFNNMYDEYFEDDPRNFLTFQGFWEIIHPFFRLLTKRSLIKIDYNPTDIIGYFDTCHGVGQQFLNSRIKLTSIAPHDFDFVDRPSDFLRYDNVPRIVKMPMVII